MNSELRHPYLQYVGVRVGGRAIAIDYQSTIYWGQVISIAETGYVTLKYYAGETKGYKTKEFHPYRCWGNDYDEDQPPNWFLQTRYGVLEHFQHYVIPKLRAFPEYYAEIEYLNSIVYCQHCSKDEEFCDCPCCEDCGQYTHNCYCDPEYANDPFDGEPDSDLDDLDGEYCSWLCAYCGDPAYDCGCEPDSEVSVGEAYNLAKKADN